MTRYRVIFQDSGKDSRRSETTYIRLLVWGGEKYVGAWFGLLNQRATLRYLGDPEDAARYVAMAPVALASTIRDAIESGEMGAPRDVPLHPTHVLSLPPENHEWSQGDEVLVFDA